MRSLRDFLARRSLFLTGATGFLGKALQEKILRDVPDIGRLYVLVRPGRRPDGSVLAPAERLRREIFEAAISARLRQTHGERFWSFIEDKVVPVAGDLTSPGLGIEPAVLERLRAEVDIVVHAAASVNFDERIDHAVQMNTLGPGRLLELTRSFRKPAIFILVSTAYVSGIRRGRVPEAPAPPGTSAAQLARAPGAPALDVAQELADIDQFTRAAHAQADSPSMARAFQSESAAARASGESDEPVEALTAIARDTWLEKTLVAEGMRRARRLGWHEVYTFTKAMGEARVIAERGDMPVAIVRPSIIESSLREPEPGWINGLKVADPLIAGYAKGRIPDFPARPEIVLDLVPVDFVVNAILAACERTEREGGLAVYHIATGARNPLRVREMFQLMQAYYRRHPMRDKTGEPIRASDWSLPSVTAFRLKYRWGYQAPLALGARLVRASPFLPWPEGLASKLGRSAEAVGKLLYYLDIYSPYTNLDCVYESDHTKALFDGLTPEDKERFNFDVESISWPHYIQDVHLSGLDRHVLRFGRAFDSGPKRGRAARPRVSTEDLRTLPDLLRLSADRFRDKVALQVKRDGVWVRLTYRDLLARAGIMGTLWRRLGLRRGERVVLIAENQPEWAVAHMAAQCVGVTVVQIDIHTPQSEIEETVDFTEARAILTTQSIYPLLPKKLKSSPLPIWDILNEGRPFQEKGEPTIPLPLPSEVRWEELSPDDVAAIIFTSGPAVEPRGVMLTHRNFLANLLSLSEALRSYETDRFVSVLPLHHALEYTGGLLMPLFSGATVTYAQTLKSKVILDLMEETGATALLAVPRIFEMLLDRLRRGPIGGEEEAPPEGKSQEVASFVNRIRLLVSGGAPLDYSIYEGFAELGTPIHEGYGLTETAPILTVNPLWGIRPRSVGTALPGVELILDQPDETGEGEIVVRGPNLMKGYLKNPQATARVLRDGWLYTGDLGRLDADGYLTITGRSKELIVTGAGKNVWPEEVELFYRAVDGVRELAVFGVREPGATRETVHLAVRIDGDEERVLEAIHRVSRERPTYQRVQHTHFWDTDLPRLPDGSRFDRKALREAVLEKIQERKKTRRTKAVTSSDTPWWERETLAILSRIAARPAEEGISPRESLSQLFDSLQSVELMAALESRLGLSISEQEAESLHTVGAVLERVKQAVGDRAEPLPGDLDVPAAGDYWAKALQAADSGGHPPDHRASAAMGPLRGLFGLGASALLHGPFRLSVRGADRLPTDTPYLIAANHQSHLDSVALLAALRSRTSRVHILGARDYFFDTPAKGWFFRNFLNLVPFDRDKDFIEGLRACRRVLAKDEPVLIFPEGTRSPNGHLQPFKVGLGILALELGTPVVPARIRGTFEALPKGRRWPRLHRIDVAFGEAVDMEPFRARRGDDNVYDLYREVVNEVRQRVEQLLEEA